jgi:hypothetical protein
VQNTNIRKLFLYLLIASVALSAVIGIVVILIGNFGEFESKVLLTTLTITVTSILGLACGAYLETGRGRILPAVGIVFALAAGVLWVVMVWTSQPESTLFPKVVMTVTLVAASCSHLSLISMARLDRRFLWSRYAAHGAVWGLSAFLIYLIWFVQNPDQEIFGRVVGVLGILVAALTVMTPVFHKLSAPDPTPDEIDREIASLKERIAELEAKKAAAV